MNSDVRFRWLGVAGIELTANGRTLALDPFFSRPPFRRFLHGRVTPDRPLVRRKLRACDYVLVSHSHWDHVMDVPEVARNTGAAAFGSPNTCRLLELLGVPDEQIHLIAAGERLKLDPFVVDVLPADHGYTAPMLGPGPLDPDLRPPLRIRDYRMDLCLSFLVEVEGYRLLLLPGRLVPADLLFVVPVRRRAAHYTSMLRAVRPSVLVPVHWDNLFAPLSAPPREVTRPASLGLKELRGLIRRTAPSTRYLIPRMFHWYDLSALCKASGPGRWGDQGAM